MVEMSRKKRVMAGVLLGLVLLFVAAQFIRPTPNRSEGASTAGIQTAYEVPEDVQQLLKRSCYDCHSNNTTYPWYSYVQPVGWLLNGDISEGKDELNFDEFASYPAFRQYRRLEAIRNQVEEGEMPLPAYAFMHRSAALNEQERERIILWVQALQDTMKARYPLDSLRRAPRAGQPPSARE